MERNEFIKRSREPILVVCNLHRSFQNLEFQFQSQRNHQIRVCGTSISSNNTQQDGLSTKKTPLNNVSSIFVDEILVRPRIKFCGELGYIIFEVLCESELVIRGKLSSVNSLNFSSETNKFIIATQNLLNFLDLDIKRKRTCVPISTKNNTNIKRFFGSKVNRRAKYFAVNVIRWGIHKPNNRGDPVCLVLVRVNIGLDT
mmetsp:Transcript_38537/g.61092  ORF Transcript_38537/g.61092 Transcript_38537/m.61092 type:complete len:200 (-) Transcript_38537:195-794(-)